MLDALRLGSADKLLRGTPPHAVVNEWVDLVKARYPKLAGLTNAVLRRVALPDDPPRAVRLGLAPWLLERFDAALGPDAERAAAGMLEPAPLWVTALRADAPELLERDGVDVTAGPLPATLALRSPRPLSALAAWREGAIQAQNPSASLPVRLLAPAPGEPVLELAAGSGVKTAQLAAAGADVTAVDLSPAKLARAERNLARLGLRARHEVADLTRPADALPAARAVLLDAPCSGTGTLRGNPEIKLRLGPGDVADLAALQARLLDTAATRVLPGGRLVYAVCALTEAEGPAQVAAFLERRPDFAAVAAPPDAVASLPQRAAAVGAFVLPLGGLDGFYLARLERRGGAAPFASAGERRT